MRVGVPKEIKNHEYRVGLVPSSVLELVHHGHEVFVQKGAGLGAGLTDEDYVAAGARIIETADEIFANADMIVKVKEPLAEERKKLRPGQILFTYLHLAPDAPQTKDLIDSGAVCIAYETVTAANGSLPLLTPMSEVAGECRGLRFCVRPGCCGPAAAPRSVGRRCRPGHTTTRSGRRRRAGGRTGDRRRRDRRVCRYCRRRNRCTCSDGRHRRCGHGGRGRRIHRRRRPGSRPRVVRLARVAVSPRIALTPRYGTVTYGTVG